MATYTLPYEAAGYRSSLISFDVAYLGGLVLP